MHKGLLVIFGIRRPFIGRIFEFKIIIIIIIIFHLLLLLNTCTTYNGATKIIIIIYNLYGIKSALHKILKTENYQFKTKSPQSTKIVKC